jgi:aryl-alcohol dehydrogenase-like predicted oxidoreductase
MQALDSRRPSRVPRRRLGKTGVDISVLGLGTAPSGHRSEREALALYRECLDAGVTHIDTGPRVGGYGSAQNYLRQILAERRADLFIATRCCEANGEQALRQLRQNLSDLNVEQVDLVYVQSLGDDHMAPERIFAADGVCHALEKARADGLTRFLGVSGHHRPWRFLKAIEEWEFDVMMNAVSIVSRHLYDFETQVWPAAASRGIALLGMKVFGGVRDSATSAKGANIPDELKPEALRYALGIPDVSGVVIGMADVGELRGTLRWLEQVAPLTDADLARLDAPTRGLAAQWCDIYGPVV